MSVTGVPTAVLDANVLVSERLRDYLLLAAQEGVYNVWWSRHILEELDCTLVLKLFAGAEDAAYLFSRMRTVFPRALVSGYESLIEAMTNDPKDRHILAAAVHAQADMIVTFNLRHFPAAALAPHDIRAVSPDTFLLERFAENPDAMVAVLHCMERERTRPRRSAAAILDAFARLTPRFAAAVRGRLPT